MEPGEGEEGVEEKEPEDEDQGRGIETGEIGALPYREKWVSYPVKKQRQGKEPRGR